MRPIKAFCLAAVAALAAMAFVGTGSASAVVLCEESKLHTEECPTKKIYGSGHVTGVGEALFIDEFFEEEVRCKSEILGLVETNTVEGLPILIEKWTFSNCTGICKEVKADYIPLLMALFKKLDAPLRFDPDFGGGKDPGVVLEKCFEPLFTGKCLYQGKEILFTYKTGNKLFATEVPIPGGGGLCPTGILFYAEYSLTKDMTKEALYTVEKP